MQIHLQEISIREVANGYKNDQEEGVVGYAGILNIRPKYQREFVYKDTQRNAVIETVRKNFPLNVMYWVKNSDGTYEVLDGQQRTISICEYIDGKYSLDYQYFHNLEESEKEQILNYKLMIYICEGNDREKLDWFKTINIAGEKRLRKIAKCCVKIVTEGKVGNKLQLGEREIKKMFFVCREQIFLFLF